MPVEIKDDWPEWARKHWADPEQWRPLIIKHALSMRVLVIANTRIEGTWCAYCDAVPGIDHEREQAEVLRSGDKLPESVARALFPTFDFLPYAR